MVLTFSDEILSAVNIKKNLSGIKIISVITFNKNNGVSPTSYLIQILIRYRDKIEHEI
jgi:hypothetical protein